jgi:release factor glutamine methyltransferase
VADPAGQSAPKLLELLRLAAEYLERRGVEDARLEAEHLLAHTLGTDRVGLYVRHDRPVAEEEVDAFRGGLRRRGEGEPLQFILGHADFRDLRLKARPKVLIPRPETGEIIELAAEEARRRGAPFSAALDVGCGAGTLCLALLEEGVAEGVVGVDVQREPLGLTRENAQDLGFEVAEASGGGNGDAPRVRLVKPLGGGRGERWLELLLADGFAPDFAPPGAPFPLVVSNPPYVSEEEYRSLEAVVRDHEPREALASGADGLDAHRALAALLPRLLRPGGLFLGEIGAPQGEAAEQLHRAWADRVELKRDLAGHDRVVAARRAGEEP